MIDVAALCPFTPVAVRPTLRGGGITCQDRRHPLLVVHAGLSAFAPVLGYCAWIALSQARFQVSPGACAAIQNGRRAKHPMASVVGCPSLAVAEFRDPDAEPVALRFNPLVGPYFTRQDDGSAVRAAALVTLFGRSCLAQGGIDLL